MTSGVIFAVSERLRLAGLCAAFVILFAGCAPSDPAIRDAINEVNREFRREYETILTEKGTRVYKVSQAEAYDAVRVSLARLGMTVETQDPVLGFVNVYAPAPRPLTREEWNRAAETELPHLHKIICPIVGPTCTFVKFEPEGLEVVISATLVSVPGGTEVSYTARMREVAPPRSGIPRREYLPPTAVRMGLDKMWAELEREFKATYRKP